MDKTTFDLGDKDCAIIFKEDMTTELILPKISDDETVEFEANQNIFVAMAISASMNDAAFRELVSQKLDEILSTVEPFTEEASSCDPAGCDGGCCGS